MILKRLKAKQDEQEQEQGPRMCDLFWDYFLSQDDKGYYRTRSLNEVMHLHFKGFKKIENMEEFTQLKCIYAEGNCFDTLEGLENSTELRSIYFQDNFIKSFNGLESLKMLKLINLTNNDISKIDDGILHLKDTLENLYLKNNKIGVNGLDDVMNLTQMHLVNTLDLQCNKLKDPLILQEVFKKMNIKVLQMQNNEAVKSIKNQRKTMISELETLTQLDERPVFEEERRFAEAFQVGGKDAEKAERVKWDEERREKQLQYLRDFDNLVSRSKAKRAQNDETPREPDILKEVEETLTEDQKKKIHDLAFSTSTTEADQFNTKGDYLKNKEAHYSKNPMRQQVNTPKPKQSDLVFEPDDIESDIQLNPMEMMRKLACNDDQKPVTKEKDEQADMPPLLEEISDEQIKRDKKNHKEMKSVEKGLGADKKKRGIMIEEVTESLDESKSHTSTSIQANASASASVSEDMNSIEKMSENESVQQSVENESADKMSESQSNTGSEFRFQELDDNNSKSIDEVSSLDNEIEASLDYDEVECTNLDDLD